MSEATPDLRLTRTRSFVRPPIAGLAATLIALAGLAALIGAPWGAKVVGLALVVGAGALVYLSVTWDRHGGPVLELRDGGIVVSKPPGVASPIVVPDDAIREVIIDPDGVRVGADRVRFPASDFPSETEFYVGDRGGSELLLAIHEARHANAAFIFNRPHVLPAPRLADEETMVTQGFAVEFLDPIRAARALGDIVRVRIVPSPRERNVSHDAREVHIVGQAGHVETRSHRVLAATALTVGLISIGVCRALIKNGNPIGWIALCLVILVGATAGFARDRRRRGPSRDQASL